MVIVFTTQIPDHLLSTVKLIILAAKIPSRLFVLKVVGMVRLWLFHLILNIEC